MKNAGCSFVLWIGEPLAGLSQGMYNILIVLCEARMVYDLTRFQLSETDSYVFGKKTRALWVSVLSTLAPDRYRHKLDISPAVRSSHPKHLSFSTCPPFSVADSQVQCRIWTGWRLSGHISGETQPFSSIIPSFLSEFTHHTLRKEVTFY